MNNKKISFAAVVKYRGSNDSGESLYAWRRCGATGRWLEPAQQGDVAQLSAALNGSNREVCLLLPASAVITIERDFNPKERRHIRKMLPYELEEELTSDVEDLHFSFGVPQDSNVALAYVAEEFVAQQLQALEHSGIEVQHCISQALSLPYLQHSWTLRLARHDDKVALHVRYAEELAFSIDAGLAAVALHSLMKSRALPENLYLFAANHEDLQQLQEWLPPDLLAQLTDLQIDTQLLDEWDSIDFASLAVLDLRQGKFARRLPIKRWAFEWRAVAAMVLVALAVFVSVNLAQIQTLKTARAELLAQEIEAARLAIPQGTIQNANKQIRDKLAGFRSTSGSTNAVYLLSIVAPVAAELENINVSGITYTQPREELRLKLEADSDSAIQEFRDKLTAKNLNVNLGATNNYGDKFGVEMFVRNGS